MAIAYVYTWMVAGLVVANRFDLLEAPGWLHFVAAHGPLVSALAVTAWADGSDGLRDLLARLVRVKFNPLWWLAVLSPVILLLLLALGMLIVTGSVSTLDGLDDVEGVGNLGLVGAAIFWVVTFGLGEETGWRGFLQHDLDRRTTSRNNALIVGSIWAAWHLPFFFYNDSYMAMGPVGVFGWLIGLMAGAVFLAWLYQGTGGSILTVIVWHALFNLGTASPAAGQLVAPILSVAVIVAAIVIRNVQHQQRRAILQEPTARVK